MYRKIAAATAVAALVVPAAAQAHVTLQPNSAPAGAFTVLNVRVPTERDNASTSKVDVQFPAGFASASYEPKPGWRVRVVRTKLATPIQTDDGPITEGVSRMVWTRTSKRGGIKPGQFMDFPISVQIPGKAGDKLTFKALQTYSNGEIVRWIGAPGSDEPAPQVTVTGAAAGAAASTHSGMATGATSGSSKVGPAQPAAAADSGDSNGLSIAALVVGALGLLFGGGALAMARRRSGGPSSRGPVTA
jgi:periplasmic copper chaperone A